MRNTLTLLLAGIVTACQPEMAPPAAPTADLDGATSTEAAFWSWFDAHQAEVAKVERADEPIADDLARELHKVDRELTFELGVNASPHELIISADGIQRVFPAVKRLVAAAPAIPGWKVIAFKPRHEGALGIQMGDGTKLSRDDLTFKVVGTEAGKLDVVLYVKPVRTVSDSTKRAVYLQLDSVLGEYDVETKLAGIEIEPGAAAPQDARPLRDLPAVVDATK
jgi:hypothetical protein